MYSFIVILLTVIWTVRFRRTLSRLATDLAALYAVLVFTLFAIYAVQILSYDETGGTGFFALFSPDGQRYLDEARSFFCIFCLNELRGEYISDSYVYVTTPKMGLSGFIAAVTPGWTPGPAQAYAFLVLAVAITGYIKIKIIDCFDITSGAKIILTFVIVLFPTDLYFSARFLREPVANDLLIIGLLIIFLYQFRGRHSDKFIQVLPLVIAALILWRAQLAVFLAIFSIVLLPLRWQTFVIFFPLTALAFIQVVRAVSILSIVQKIGWGFAQTFFREVIDAEGSLSSLDAIAFLLPLLVSFIWPLNFRESRIGMARFMVISIVIMLPWAFADLGQIRFIYPALMWIKASIALILVHHYRLVWRSVRVASGS